MSNRIYDEPSEVDAEEGVVLVDGPDGVSVSLSPEAAEETSDRLLFHAGRAKSQQITAGKRKPGALKDG